jgi:hypothetical protein
MIVPGFTTCCIIGKRVAASTVMLTLSKIDICFGKAGNKDDIPVMFTIV